MLCSAALTVGSVAACSAPKLPADADGVQISTTTPQGVRAQQILDMLNSDWPISQESVKTLAGPEQVDFVTTAMDQLWWERPYRVAEVDYGAATAELQLATSYGGRQTIDIRTAPSTLVDRFKVSTPSPVIGSWEDVDHALGQLNGRYAYQVSKISDGRCDMIAGSNTDVSMPLASIFKTYVLLAVAQEVAAGRLSWDDEVTVTAKAKAVGSSAFDKLKPGATIPVRLAAEKMISSSDNMATDLLIERVGKPAVTHALVTAGHHDPASMTPFPTMHEMFSIGWGIPDLREQWRDADRAQRDELLRETDLRPYKSDPQRTHTPAAAYGAQWFGSPADVCRIHVALQQTGQPVRDIMAALPGIDLDRAKWPYIGAKAGNLPGDLTFSWYVEDRSGQPWVVSLQTSWDTFHGGRTAAWLMGVVKGMFALIPTQ
ncbi:serine hydrolase [Mycolicibacterium brumae]|uniref:Serine hydrolase n=1 Tax=Mycolicibacterium brumae TaxID=85968 RepID=A0A2G5P7G2_9MYCO|nr:serine hydrolase [Mycolicibacterium brumae]